jgi:hypothetical protein
LAEDERSEVGEPEGGREKMGKEEGEGREKVVFVHGYLAPVVESGRWRRRGT